MMEEAPVVCNKGEEHHLLLDASSHVAVPIRASHNLRYGCELGRILLGILVLGYLRLFLGHQLIYSPSEHPSILIFPPLQSAMRMQAHHHQNSCAREL
jgi:hypothetical protein